MVVGLSISHGTAGSELPSIVGATFSVCILFKNVTVVLRNKQIAKLTKKLRNSRENINAINFISLGWLGSSKILRHMQNPKQGPWDNCRSFADYGRRLEGTVNEINTSLFYNWVSKICVDYYIFLMETKAISPKDEREAPENNRIQIGWLRGRDSGNCKIWNQSDQRCLLEVGQKFPSRVQVRIISHGLNKLLKIWNNFQYWL